MAASYELCRVCLSRNRIESMYPLAHPSTRKIFEVCTKTEITPGEGYSHICYWCYTKFANVFPILREYERNKLKIIPTPSQPPKNVQQGSWNTDVACIEIISVLEDWPDEEPQPTPPDPVREKDACQARWFCPVCLLDQKDETSHMDTHVLETKSQCAPCSKKFNLVQHLINHIIQDCPDCYKQIIAEEVVLKHLDIREKQKSKTDEVGGHSKEKGVEVSGKENDQPKEKGIEVQEKIKDQLKEKGIKVQEKNREELINKEVATNSNFDEEADMLEFAESDDFDMEMGRTYPLRSSIVIKQEKKPDPRPQPVYKPGPKSKKKVINSGSCSCPICEVLFTDGAELREHLIEDHETNVQNCPVCSKRQRKKNMVRHIMERHTTINRQCPHCAHTFPKEPELWAHVKRVHQDFYPWTCPLCEELIDEYPELKTHLEESHFVEEDLDCHLCERVVKSDNEMISHIVRDHLKKWRCDECGGGFLSESSLNSHLERGHSVEQETMKTIEVRGDLQCHLCDDFFVNFNKYKTHMDTHMETDESDEERQVKEVKPKKKILKSRWSRGLVKTGKKMNANTSNFHCAICKRGFSESKYLQTHQKATKGMCLHQSFCITCNMPFKSPHYLNVHNERWH